MKSLSIAFAVLLGGCMVGEVIEEGGDTEVAHDDDMADGHSDGQPRANTNGWVIPANIAAIGDEQYVSYTGAGAWNGGKNCGGGLLAGTRELGDYVRANFTGVSSYGGYACRRNTANTSELSVHGTGRAIDIMIPMKSGRANSTAGDPIANFLVQNAEKIGVQFIIWNRNSWSASRSKPKLRSYGGPVPHTDHIHVELSPDGARRLTAWFNDTGNAPPPVEPDPGSETATATVNASALNLRTGPGTMYSVITSMPNGSTVTINQAPSQGWYNVTFNGKTGWCSGDYLDL